MIIIYVPFDFNDQFQYIWVYHPYLNQCIMCVHVNNIVWKLQICCNFACNIESLCMLNQIFSEFVKKQDTPTIYCKCILCESTGCTAFFLYFSDITCDATELTDLAQRTDWLTDWLTDYGWLTTWLNYWLTDRLTAEWLSEKKQNVQKIMCTCFIYVHNFKSIIVFSKS